MLPVARLFLSKSVRLRAEPTNYLVVIIASTGQISETMSSIPATATKYGIPPESEILPGPKVADPDELSRLCLQITKMNAVASNAIPIIVFGWDGMRDR
jgi:hypothetical protein